MTVPAKTCAQCGLGLRQESPSQLARRTYCSRRCAGLGLRPAFTWDWFDTQIVKTDNCWIWVGGRARGYGRVWKDGRKQYAHRLSYERATGAVVGDLDVLHSCDNPRCVNPAHLSVGTQADNNKDMWGKGRARPPRGISNGCSKLFDEAVRLIRNSAMSSKELAELFGVSSTAIRYVRSRKTWRHVK